MARSGWITSPRRIGEERDTIEDVLEPYLIQQGYLSAHRAAASRRRMRTAISALPLPAGESGVDEF